MLLLSLLSAGAMASCRVEDAHYALRTAPRVTAGFRDVPSGPDWPSEVALQVRFADTGRSYWWLPWAGGTDDLQHVASTTDVTRPGWRPPSPDGGPRPYGDLEYVGADPAFNIIDATPKRGGIAPAHFLLTRLGDVVWHGGASDKRDSAPKQFFDLVSCSPSP